MRILWKARAIDLTNPPSVRIRVLTPVLLLRRQGFDITLTDKRPAVDEISRADAIVITKSFSPDDNWLAATAKELKKTLIVDLCDDLFAESDRAREADAFRYQAGQADLIVTTGERLAAAIANQVGGRGKIEIIPDHAETIELTRELVTAFPPSDDAQSARIFGPPWPRALLRRLSRRERPLSSKRKTIVWFGRTGPANKGRGIDALSALAPQLNAIAKDIPLQLLIVTSGRSRAKRATQGLRFPWMYREWHLIPTFEHVAKADVCIVPNPPTDFALAKSANRALLALAAGTPVVASSTPAHEPLADVMVLDDWDRGLRRYLTDSGAVKADVAAARELIEREYAPVAIRDLWSGAISRTVARRADKPENAKMGMI